VPQFSNFVDTIYQQSDDGGRTFSAPLKVNSTPSDVRFAAISTGTYEINCNGQPCSFLGDYFGIASSGNRTYVARSEGHPLSAREPATFPPTVYHQRNWVAVLEMPEASATTRLPRALPDTATGLAGITLAMALAAPLVGALSRRRRPTATG
jgi:hypothetical protein